MGCQLQVWTVNSGQRGRPVPTVARPVAPCGAPFPRALPQRRLDRTRVLRRLEVEQMTLRTFSRAAFDGQRPGQHSAYAPRSMLRAADIPRTQPGWRHIPARPAEKACRRRKADRAVGVPSAPMRRPGDCNSRSRERFGSVRLGSRRRVEQIDESGRCGSARARQAQAQHDQFTGDLPWCGPRLRMDQSGSATMVASAGRCNPLRW